METRTRGLLARRPKLKPTEQALIVLLGYRRVKICLPGLQRKKEGKDQIDTTKHHTWATIRIGKWQRHN